MKILLTSIILILSLFIKAQNVIIVIIDGARYTETFGDANATYIPKMAEMAKQGTLITEFYNDSVTSTSAAIPAIWCGTWTPRIDTFYNDANTQYAVKPTIFEYFRKQKNMLAEQCLYSLKYVPSLWLPSFDQNYGPNYWPFTISQGDTDADVLDNSINALIEHKPQFAIIYFADVDHYGHSGNWDNYVQAIRNADSAVDELWKALQADSHYKNNTVLFVTNDHGRHDDLSGGFKGHGCSCQGCRKIMFMAIGPNIKVNNKSRTYRRIPDIAVTAASILGIDPEYATGQVAHEIFETGTNVTINESISWHLNSKFIEFSKCNTSSLQVTVHNINGTMVYNHKFKNATQVKWNQGYANGVYIVSVSDNAYTSSKKIVIQ